MCGCRSRNKGRISPYRKPQQASVNRTQGQTPQAANDAPAVKVNTATPGPRVRRVITPKPIPRATAVNKKVRNYRQQDGK